MFGRRRARVSREMLAVADERFHAVLARHDRMERALCEALDVMRTELASRADVLDEALERIATIGRELIDRVDADRFERRALTVAVERLARSVSQPLAASAQAARTSAVIGGSFFGMDDTAALLPDVPADASSSNAGLIALHDDVLAVPLDQHVEVRCRFGDRWVDGFEVCERVAEDDRVRYRLRRRAD